MSAETQLLERIEKLRDALVELHDRDPHAEATVDPATGTHIGYADHIRQLALAALQHDDALAASRPAET